MNPIQFGPGEDLDRYPRPVGSDLEMLRAAGVDAAYTPSAQAMYPPGATTRVLAGPVAATLEGAARPGHFEGVATVVTKLFWATRADRAYFGQKDAQQVAVVQRLAADLDSGVEIVVCSTVREADGLAVSSRNAYLDARERAAAVSLSNVLAQTKALDVLTSALFAWMTPHITSVWSSTMVLYWSAFVYHIVIGNEIAMLSTSLPILMKFARDHALDPLALGMVWTFGAGPKLFIYESAVLVVGYSYGYFDNKDMLKIGGALSIVTAVILLLLVPLYWPLIGITR